MYRYSVIGRRIPRLDAAAKVTGRALYAADMALPDMLHGKILRSPHAHARIKRLDVTRALKLDGVMAVITARDVPCHSQTGKSPDPMSPCIALEEVMYAGQPVAAVAARTPYIADDALALIEAEYEVLPAATDVLEAIKPGAPVLHPDRAPDNLPAGSNAHNVFSYIQTRLGDPDAGFKEADVIVENSYRTQTVHQGFLEPRATLASVDPGGMITVWTDNQSIFVARELIAEFMEVPISRVRVMPVDVGGAFGGKEPQVMAPVCVLLSSKAGLPVRIVLTREEVFKDSRPAPASSFTVKMGATRDGKITAAQMSMVFDYGAFYGVDGLMDVPWAFFTGLSPYVIPNRQIESYSVFTNKAPSGPYRSPTAPQGAFAVESQIDLLARAIEMDPLEFRLRNVAVEGDYMPLTGQSYGKIGFKETLERMKEHLAQHPAPRGRNRGRGIACGFWMGAAAAAGAYVTLNADGSAHVLVGCVDVSGSATSLAQIAAEELGLPIDRVSITVGGTDTAPYSSASVGSLTMRSAGTAVSEACKDLRQQLYRRAASRLQVEPETVDYSGGVLKSKAQPDRSVSIDDLAAQSIGFAPFNIPLLGRGAGGGQPPSPALSVQAVDVEVDPGTGKVTILASAVAQDTGLAINPLSIEGQMQGAAAQGAGWALYEGYVFKDGVMQNCSLLDYRMPTAADMPRIDTVIVEVRSSTTPFGIRGAGEAPMVPGPAAMANAIHDATGARLTALPMNPEAVLGGIKKVTKTGRT